MTFIEALKADPERARGVEFVGVFIPGLNTTDYSALAPDARIASTFVSPPFAEAFAAGRLRYLPKAYSGFASTLARMKLDLAVLRVSPPGPDGRMSFGLNQDYAPIAARTGCGCARYHAVAPSGSSASSSQRGSLGSMRISGASQSTSA